MPSSPFAEKLVHFLLSAFVFISKDFTAYWEIAKTV